MAQQMRNPDNLAHMNNSGVVSILEFSIKLSDDLETEFKITEDPNYQVKLTFFDFHSQISK